MRCLHVWLQSPVQLLIKVDHRDVHMDEVAAHLSCPRPGWDYDEFEISVEGAVKGIKDSAAAVESIRLDNHLVALVKNIPISRFCAFSSH